MKKVFFLSLIVIVFANCKVQKRNINNVQKININNMNDSLSYAIGISIVNNLNQQQFEKLNTEVLTKAFNDFYEGKPDMTPEEAGSLIQSIMTKKNAENSKPLIEEGEKFLAENKNKEGVTTTASGLQYKILTEGTGNIPTSNDKVKVHYKGTLINGTVFDSSYDRGEPTVFGVTQVIAGWTEVLQLMKEGAKYEVYIPYNLAYGERGAGQDIKPFSTLIFTVELISIEK